MILQESNHETIAVGMEGKERKFGISDNKVIFDVLRNKLYTDRIGAICREVASNSRDANRENGKAAVPIVIKMHNTMTSDFGVTGDGAISFKDSGIGISQERMNKVFLYYGESTKRNTNDQTGGFGLGAKTPFAYSDSFSIVTTVKEGDKNMKYFYMATIGKDEKGDLHLVRSVETLEETGTEIIIPLKRHDMTSFEEKVIRYTQFWKVRPKLVNFYTKFVEEQFTKEISKDVTYYSDTNFSGGTIILIDEIPYKINLALPRLKHNSTLAINFPNGLFDIGAAREEIRVDETSKGAIVNAVAGVMKECGDKLRQIYDNMTLSEALFEKAKAHYKKGTSDLSIFENILNEEKGIERNKRTYKMITSFSFFSRYISENLTKRNNIRYNFENFYNDNSFTLYEIDVVDVRSRARQLNKDGVKFVLYKEHFNVGLYNFELAHHIYTRLPDKFAELVLSGAATVDAALSLRPDISFTPDEIVKIEHSIKIAKELYELESEIIKMMFPKRSKLSNVARLKGEKTPPREVKRVIYVTLSSKHYDNDGYLYPEKRTRSLSKKEKDQFKDLIVIECDSVSSSYSYNIDNNIAAMVLATIAALNLNVQLIAAATNYNSIVGAGATPAEKFLESLTDEQKEIVRKYVTLGSLNFNFFKLIALYKSELSLDEEDKALFDGIKNIDISVKLLKNLNNSTTLMNSMGGTDEENTKKMVKFMEKYQMINLIDDLKSDSLKQSLTTINEYFKQTQQWIKMKASLPSQ